MFEFISKFDELENDIVHLKIIEKSKGDKNLLPFYYYDIYENKSNKNIGKISIRIGENYDSYYNGNIGYEIDKSFRGHSYSFHASKLVLNIAKEHGMDFIYITCNESNYASRRIIERLGGILKEITDVPKNYFAWYDGICRHCIYKLIL